MIIDLDLSVAELEVLVEVCKESGFRQTEAKQQAFKRLYQKAKRELADYRAERERRKPKPGSFVAKVVAQAEENKARERRLRRERRGR